METSRWADRGAASFQLGGGSSKKDGFPRLEGLIRYACESMNVSALQRYAQENMDAHAAVCDEITSKGIETNAACHAVYMVVQRYINGSVLDNARRGLQLLDSCVKNCGDPCHLAISEKDFLNELVRRFGPTPPPRNIIQQDILKLIETWNRSIAKKSFIKEDLGYIRDMHRLLSNKGFVFPDPDPDDINALNGLEVKGLQTEDALKERRNFALKAKLQAYLRRGGNRNLQEANKIIKVLSDYDQSDKAELRQEAADRIQNVRERTQLLTERLKAIKSSAEVTAGDAFESLVDDLKSEQRKLHNTLQNDRESEDSMTVLLAVNEEINRVIEWYDALKSGDTVEAQRLSQGGPAKGTMNQTSSRPSNAVDLSLIDFDDPPPVHSEASAGTHLQDDLLGLSLNDTSSSQNSTAIGSSSSRIPPGFPQLDNSSPQAERSSNGDPQMPVEQRLEGHAQTQTSHILNSSASSSANGNLTGLVIGGSPRPLSLLGQQKAQTPTSQPPQNPKKPLPNLDPFASIASSARSSPRPSSSSQPTNLLNSEQTSSSTFTNAGFSSSAVLPSAPDRLLVNTAATDDDWDFSGAPPPEEEDFVVFNNDIKIEFQVSRVSDTALNIIVVFSNNSSDPISKLEFLTGMPKMYSRKIDPISSSRLQPHQAHGAYQRFTVEGVPKGQAKQVPKIKWRLSRSVGESSKSDQGEAQLLSIN